MASQKTHTWRILARTGNFVNISDVAHEPLYKPYHSELLGTAISARTILCMPIQGKGEVQGLAVLINKRSADVFTSKDEDILSAICSHISVSMSDTRQTFDDIQLIKNPRSM